MAKKRKNYTQMKLNYKNMLLLSAGLVLLGVLSTSRLTAENPMTKTSETPMKKPSPTSQDTSVARETPSAGDDGKQIAVPQKLTRIQRVLIVGNSLTRHGPSTKRLGWPHCWGMAATALEKDYAHQLYEKICRAQIPAGTKPQLKIATMLAYAIMTPKELLEYRPDFVVLQMGDNLKSLQATPKKFVEPYVKLVNAFKKANSDAIIILVGIWGRDSKRNSLVIQVAEATGSIFVNLRPLSSDPKNFARAEGNFTHSGVNWHPGNRGMRKIADQIWTTTIKSLSAPAAAAGAGKTE